MIDLYTWSTPNGRKISILLEELKVEYKVCPINITKNEQFNENFLKISPNNNVDQIKVPMFVVQGENDPRVPVTEAEQIVQSLRENNKKVWYMNALNEGHGYRKKENRDIYQQAVILFLQENLSPFPI